MLIFALREVGFQRETTPLLGFIPALMFGCRRHRAGLAFSSTLPLRPEHCGPNRSAT